MRFISRLIASVFIISSCAHAMDVPDPMTTVGPEIKKLFFQFLPASDQYAFHLTSHEFNKILVASAHVFNRTLTHENTDEVMDELVNFTQMGHLRSLTIEHDVDAEQLQHIFRHIETFGHMLESIDIHAFDLEAEDLLKLCTLPMLTSIKITANNNFSDQVWYEFAIGCTNITNFELFNSHSTFNENHLLNFLYNKNLRSIRIDQMPELSSSFLGMWSSLSLPNLHTFSLANSTVPCSLVEKIETVLPNIKSLTLDNLVKCSDAATTKLAAMQLDEAHFTLSDAVFSDQDLSTMTAWYTGDVHIRISTDRSSITANKHYRRNQQAELLFELLDEKKDLTTVVPFFQIVPHDHLTFRFEFVVDVNDITYIIGALIKGSDPCDKFSLDTHQHGIIIQRNKNRSPCFSSTKLNLFDTTNNYENLRDILTDYNDSLRISLDDINDFNSVGDLLDFENLQDLYLNSKREQTIDLATFNLLSKNGQLSRIQAYAKSFKFADGVVSAIKKNYSLTFHISQDNHYIALDKISHTSDHQPPLYLSLFGVPVSQLPPIPDDIGISLRIETLSGDIDWPSLFTRPNLRCLNYQQAKPFVMTSTMLDLINNSKLQQFGIEILMPNHEEVPQKISYHMGVKKALADGWNKGAAQSNDPNRFSLEFYRKSEHEKEHGHHQIKRVDRSKNDHIGTLPRNRPFMLTVNANAGIENIIEACSNSHLTRLTIVASAPFSVTAELITALSEQSHIESFNVEGPIDFAPGALAAIKDFRFISINKNKEHPWFSLERATHDPRSSDEEIRLNFFSRDSSFSFNSETTAHIEEIVGLTDISFNGHIDFNRSDIQRLSTISTLKHLRLSKSFDTSLFEHFSLFHNLKSVEIRADGEDDIDTLIAQYAMYLPESALMITNYSYKDKRDDNAFIGSKVTEDIIMQSYAHQKCGIMLPDSDHVYVPPYRTLSLINTSITGSCFVENAKNIAIDKLNLTGSNNITLETLVAFARANHECKVIVLPQALADAADALHEEFPQIKFLRPSSF